MKSKVKTGTESVIKRTKTSLDEGIDKTKGILNIFPEKGKHTHTLIFMHGLGSNASRFEDVFSANGPMHFKNLKVVLPNAPVRPVQLYMGMP